MSKKNNKDKKNDATSQIQKQFQAQKRDIIDYQYTIKKLEQRLAQKTLENDQLAKQLEQVHLYDKQQIKILKQRTQDFQRKYSLEMSKRLQFQIKGTRDQSTIKSLNEELMAERESRQKQVAQYKIKMENQRTKFRMEIQNLQIYAENREKNQQQLLNLRERIQYEQSQKRRELADKQREKVQANDKLRDQMLKKIRQMRTNLLSLKKQQLSTTTRLTILQNHQLTSELQYQSKQTQKLIFKQQQMQQKIKQLTQQLAIHKQVQEQLAKRAHFSKGVIKKLNERVSQLEKQVQNSKNTRTIQSVKTLSCHQNSGTKSKIYIEAMPDQNSTKQMLAQIEKQLQNTEKKYSQIQSKLHATQKEKQSLINRLKRNQNSCNQLAKILIQYSQQMLNKRSQGPQTQINEPILKIDLQSLRNRKVEQWSTQQIDLVVKLLLNLIKPYLTKKNILIPVIRRLLVVEDSKLLKSESKLPKIAEQGQQNSLKGLKDLPVNIATKIVGSNLREWGNTVNLNQNNLLKKKYKITQSQR